MRRISFAAVALTLASAVSGLALRSDSRSFEAGSAAEWVGSYELDHASSTLSYRLIISAGNRFSLESIGCFGTHEAARGGVSYRNGMLTLQPVLAKDELFVLGTPILIPVHHDGHLCLVEGDRGLEFLEAALSGTLNCYGGYCPDFFVKKT